MIASNSDSGFLAVFCCYWRLLFSSAVMLDFRDKTLLCYQQLANDSAVIEEQQKNSNGTAE
jgi:hypothetical protein